MYKDKTVDSLHKELLDNISDDYEKSVGTLTYDLTKSFAIQEEKKYKALQQLFDKVDIDNLKDDELTKYVYQRKGIVRKIATKSTGILTIVGNGTVNVGDLFETTSGVQFKSLESVTVDGNANVNIEATKEGSIGNVGANSITLMPITIAGIISINNTQATHDGYEAESDTNLRERYYLALRRPPTSGNKWHYMFWSKEIIGIGDCRVFPLWNGDNTVKIVIIDSNKQPASSELISQAQEYIDPNSSGLGEGQAPIGAYCTVVSAIAKQINISVNLAIDTNRTVEVVKASIENNLKEYFKSIAFKQNYVSYAKIGSVILDTDGVLDYSNLTINNTVENITIDDEEVAILGEVVLIE